MPSSPPASGLRLLCAFRIAAGPRVGYGHLMRARALAQCLDMDVVVSVRGGRAAQEAATKVGPPLRDARTLGGADVLVVDDPSPREGRSWVERARRLGVLSVSVHDDVRVLDADLVVCGSLGGGRPRTTAHVLRGVPFYLLGRGLDRTQRLSPASPTSPRRVIIALGGGQHVRRVAQRLVDAIIGWCPDAQIVVAPGFTPGRLPALRHATWLSVRTGLVQAFLKTDVAVVAGGVTLYEACALGVPAVGLAVVPAQRGVIRVFAARRAVLDAGGGVAGPKALQAAAAGVARLLADGRLRRALSARAHALVDGRGTRRVAGHITALLAGRERRCE